ncbi:MAG: hypothetical protein PHG85_07045 [Candidatus Altiarchaeota archaeon]|nr:hypothetical protein [Candidatus Altiarchaeota archaeon]
MNQMSVFDKIRQYKEQYDEMDPYRREQLHMGVLGAIIVIVAAYLILNSLGVIEGFFSN